MIKEAVISFIMSAVASAVITSVVVGLLIGDRGIPADLMSNVIGNNITAVMCGGLSGLVTTILAWKKHKLH